MPRRVEQKVVFEDPDECEYFEEFIFFVLKD